MKLKPCPFCGGKALFHQWGSSDKFCIYCENGCCERGDYKTRAIAFAAWNRRAGEKKGGSMNIRITVNGHLEIERAGKFVEQKCPFTSVHMNGWNDIKWGLNEMKFCGDWCPLFGEPREWTGGEDGMALGLCQGTLIGHIEDLRGKP